MSTLSRTILAILGAAILATGLSARSQTGQGYEPTVGQAGKDVIWVPTPQELVDKMLDMAQVTPSDYVVDLGSGDGRTVITAAKRGARAMGIEYNPDMVALSNKNAATAGVSQRATFVQADLFESADLYTKADVITMFLLPSINLRLRPTILGMKPGTRVVSNTFTMDDWEADETQTIGNCGAWCRALLWIVPAHAEGKWRLGNTTLTLSQKFQMLSGSLGSTAITNGRMRGSEITFFVGSARYSGKLAGDTMSGTVTGGRGGNWTATRQKD
jgi:precorrin-6B methylase 2